MNEKLTAYVLNELPPDERAEFEAQMKTDPALRQQAEEMKVFCAMLSEQVAADDESPALTTQQRVSVMRAFTSEAPEKKIVRPFWRHPALLVPVAIAACVAFAMIWDTRETESGFAPAATPAAGEKVLAENVQVSQAKAERSTPASSVPKPAPAAPEKPRVEVAAAPAPALPSVAPSDPKGAVAGDQTRVMQVADSKLKASAPAAAAAAPEAEVPASPPAAAEKQVITSAKAPAKSLPAAQVTAGGLFADTIILKTGEKFDCTILSETNTTLTYKYKLTAKIWDTMTIRKTDIKERKSFAPTQVELAAASKPALQIEPKVRLGPVVKLDTVSTKSIYASQWLGTFTIRTAGAYTFSAKAGESSRMYIDGVLVLTHDGTKAGSDIFSMPVQLAAGPHEMRVESVSNAAALIASLGYAGPDTGSSGGQAPADGQYARVAMNSSKADLKVAKAIATPGFLTAIERGDSVPRSFKPGLSIRDDAQLPTLSVNNPALLPGIHIEGGGAIAATNSSNFVGILGSWATTGSADWTHSPVSVSNVGNAGLNNVFDLSYGSSSNAPTTITAIPTTKVKEVERHLEKAYNLYNLGDYSNSGIAFQDALRVDPYNHAARRGMEQAEQKRAEYFDAARNQMRAKLLNEVNKGWEDVIPATLSASTGTVGFSTNLNRGDATINSLNIGAGGTNQLAAPVVIDGTSRYTYTENRITEGGANGVTYGTSGPVLGKDVNYFGFQDYNGVANNTFDNSRTSGTANRGFTVNTDTMADAEKPFTSFTMGGNIDSSGTGALAFGGTGGQPAATSGGKLRNSSGNNTYGGPIALQSASRSAPSDAGAGTAKVNRPAMSPSAGQPTVVLRGNVVTAESVGSGGLTKFGNGNLTLDSANTYVGGVTLNGGTMVNAGTQFAINDAPVGTSVSGRVFDDVAVGQGGRGELATAAAANAPGNNPQTLTKSGAGTLDLTYTGGTTVSAGTLMVVNGNVIGDTDVAKAQDKSYSTDADALRGSGATSAGRGRVATGGDLTIIQNNTRGAVEISSAIADTTVTKAGTGTWVLDGANTYTGTTTVNEGTLTVGGGVLTPLQKNEAGKASAPAQGTALFRGTGLGSEADLGARNDGVTANLASPAEVTASLMAAPTVTTTSGQRATVNVTAGSGATTFTSTPPLVNGIIGGWATTNPSESAPPVGATSWAGTNRENLEGLELAGAAPMASTAAGTPISETGGVALELGDTRLGSNVQFGTSGTLITSGSFASATAVAPSTPLTVNSSSNLTGTASSAFGTGTAAGALGNGGAITMTGDTRAPERRITLSEVMLLQSGGILVTPTMSEQPVFTAPLVDNPTVTIQIAPGPPSEQELLERERARLAEKNEQLRRHLYELEQRNVEIARRDTSNESYAHIYENPFLFVQQQPLSTFSIDVDSASYANVRRFLNAGHRPPPDAVRLEELINYFPYSYEGPSDGKPFGVMVDVAEAPWQPLHRLVRVALKGREVTDDRGPANFVFLVDVSGSMSSEDKLPLVKRSLEMLTRQLGKNDRVAMVVYAGSSGLVLPSTPGTDRDTILDAIGRLQSGGSTNGAGGITQAYQEAAKNFVKGGVNRVILCTDGDFNVGISSDKELEKLIAEKAKSRIFLSVLGFGTGNVKDSKMETLADKGNGNYAYIDSLSEARKVLVEQMNGTLVTIAKDVKIQVEFNPTQVAAYRLLGYENRLMAKEDFNNDKKDAGEIGAGHTVTALYEVVPSRVKFPDGRPAVDELKYAPKVAATNPVEEAAAPAPATNELMTVKLRYKQPEGDKSDLLEVPVTDKETKLSEAPKDFQFAASVAGFGMLLRGSEHAGELNWDMVRDMALHGKGEDTLGYRGEFLQLIDKARGFTEVRR